MNPRLQVNGSCRRCPCAVFDTRNGVDFGDQLAGGTTVEVQVTGPVASSCPATSEVPAGTTTALVNVVVIGPSDAGNLGISRPGEEPVGVVNFVKYEANSNAVPVRLSPDGALELHVNARIDASAHVRMVVLGYYSDDVGDRFVPTAPCVILDTRNGSAFGARVLGQSTSSVQVAGTIGPDQTAEPCAPSTVPVGATGAFINVVNVAPQSSGNLRVSAANEMPLGGVVNFRPGATNANAVPVGLSTDGRIDVFVNAPSNWGTHVRLVLLGYYL